MSVDHLLNVLRRQISEVLPLEALEELPASLFELAQVCLRYAFDVVGKCSRALDTLGGVNDQSLGLHACVVFVEPSGGPIHLFGLALVDLSPVDVDFALAFDDQVTRAIKGPQVVGALLPFFVRAFTCKSRRPT